MSNRGTVYVNPYFKAHINPKFLRNTVQVPNSIHINPAFLEQDRNYENSSMPRYHQQAIEQSQFGLTQNEALAKHSSKLTSVKENHLATTDNVEAKIIAKSKTKLIRAPVNNTKINDSTKKSNPPQPMGPLTKIGLRKLIRTPSVSTAKSKPSVVNTKFVKHNVPAVNSKMVRSDITPNNVKESGQKYKIDRRKHVKPTKTSLNCVKRKIYVSHSVLRRIPAITLTPKKVIVTQYKIIKKMLPKTPNKPSSNIKLEMLNINGVLYKSTKNKLQRSTNTNIKQKPDLKTNSNALKPFNTKKSTSNSNSNGRILYIRGNKFVMDKGGLKLVKIQTRDLMKTEKNSKSGMKRIDIGGLTYVAKSNNVFVRTDTHVTRNYLSTKKQRSINTLHNRMVKNNVPCPIYRKFGKCTAFEKGKCPKLHEKRHVAICPKFLKGECSNPNCLLSHNVSFSKMPVCKFFLQGLCVRDDCPYLHRKMGKSVQICQDFLNGYCSLADECPKRHEYLCPDFESKGKCEKLKCEYCIKRIKDANMKQNKAANLVNKNKKNAEEIKEKLNIDTDDAEIGKDKIEYARYFIGDSLVESESETNSRSEFPKFSSSNSENGSQSMSDISEFDENIDDEDDNTVYKLQRQKLGVLPAYIPL